MATASQLRLSGNSYVNMFLRAKPDNKSIPVKIASSRRCAHLHTICVECADSWESDYTVQYDRTKGGRDLLDQLVKTGKK